MFGVTEAQESVLVHVHGFLPYFYVPVPANFIPERDLKDFTDALEVS